MGRRGFGSLGAAAALTIAAASAASAGPLDGPYVREKIAMPSLRNCAAEGPGFVAVPGVQTCLRLGGRVRAETGAGSRPGGAPIVTTGRLAVDARTQTEYGPVRAFVRLRSQQP